MIRNYQGWRAKRAGALARKAEAASRLEINAIRQRIYNGSATDGDFDPVEEPKEEIKETSEETKEIAPAIKPVEPESLDNAQLRAAIEGRGFEVPKNTARVRLIELYKEKVI